VRSVPPVLIPELLAIHFISTFITVSSSGVQRLFATSLGLLPCLDSWQGWRSFAGTVAYGAIHRAEGS
jgi:hypothetical protein